jgi:ribonucleoside-diphosphate reductase alpha chain
MTDTIEVHHRIPMPATRTGITHRGVIYSSVHGPVKFYITANRYDHGHWGEVFVTCDSSGSMLDGMCDTISTMLSVMLQHQVPFDYLARKFSYVEYEPKGMTECEEIGHARSIVDYVIRWMALVNKGGEQ